MTQFYFDPERENDKYALPDGETFYIDFYDIQHNFREWVKEQMREAQESIPQDYIGWYYWSCFPGCLPDSDPIGPFETEEEALKDARGE